MISLDKVLRKPDIMDIWDRGTVIMRLDSQVVFHIQYNYDISVDKIGLIDFDSAEFTDAIRKYDVIDIQKLDDLLIIHIIKKENKIMSKPIIEFTLQDAKSIVSDERLEWLNKVQNAIEELESLDVTAISHTNELWGKNFVEKELKRLYAIKDELEFDKNTFFGINVTLNFSHGVDAETYEEAVENIKDSFLEKYNIELRDEEIDPEEFDLKYVLDLLDANGYEEASNFLQLHLAKEEGLKL